MASFAFDPNGAIPAQNPPPMGTGTGDPFGFSVDSIFVSSSYVSWEFLSGSAFFPGETLATMFQAQLSNLQGQQSEVWSSGNGLESVDYLVPEPGLGVLAALAAGLGVMRRRRGAG